MSRHGGRVLAVAVTTLVLQLGVVALGAVRVCWGVEHTHAGEAAADCPMHHRPDSAPTHHSHHDHGGVGTPIGHDHGRVTCGCSNDPASVYAGPTGIVLPVASITPAIAIVMLPAASDATAVDIRFPPLSPPPRLTSSRLS